MSTLVEAIRRGLEIRGQSDTNPELEEIWKKACDRIPNAVEYRKTFSDGREWIYKRSTRPSKPGMADSMNNMADAARVGLACAACGQPAKGEHQCVKG